MTHISVYSAKFQPRKLWSKFSYFSCWYTPSSSLSLSLSLLVVPHVTDAIQDWIERVAMVSISGDDQPPDICVIEVNNN